MDIWPIRQHCSTNPIDSLLLAVDYGFDIVNFVILFSFVSFCALVSDIAIFVLKRDVKLQLTNFLCSFCRQRNAPLVFFR